MKILVLAPAAAPLGHGRAGGITTHIGQTIKALRLLGHEIEVIAPRGSILEGAMLRMIGGALQPSFASASIAAQEFYTLPPGGALAAMWRAAWARQNGSDLILNFAQDWLPYYMTDFFRTPVAHITNMGAVNGATDAEIVRVSRVYPGRVAMLSRDQAESLEGLHAPFLLSFGFDMAAYPFCALPTGGLIWAGRISPEKGLEDALRIAQQVGEPLAIAGAVDDAPYWQSLQQEFGECIDYQGYLLGEDFTAFLGTGRALLQTQKWREAFGIVTVEALACGTPVIAYDRGANREVLEDGITGFLVPADAWMAAAEKVAHLAQISRASCRAHVEAHFSLNAYAARLKTWLDLCLTGLPAQKA